MAERIWYRIRAEGTGPAVIYLYGLIGQDWWGDGNSALDFVKELEALGSRDVELRVNSDGGDVFEGYAIYNAINRYPGHVTAYVDGLAASAASLLIMAANEVVMGQASFLMIHNSWCYCVGNAAELRDVADRLEAIDEQMVAIYARRSSKDTDEIREACAATTWLDAEQALEWGLADRVDEALKVAACIPRAMAKRLQAVPVAVQIVDYELTADDEPGLVEEPGDTAPIIETTEGVADPETPGQEPEAEAEVQEHPAAKVVAYSSGIYRIPAERVES